MKSSIFSLASLLALSASLATAQVVESAPFKLIIISPNSTINGTSLTACHEGAAIEGLCSTQTMGLSDSPGSLFNHNTTTGQTVNATIGGPGTLTYELAGANFNISEPMSLSFNPTSNVAVPLFIPGYDITSVAFDKDEKMNIQGYVDDTVDPAKYEVQAYYRWYVCITYTGYTYSTLTWVTGPGAPQNPTCQKVDVKRVFI